MPIQQSAYEQWKANKRIRLANELDHKIQQERFGSPQYVDKQLSPQQSTDYLAQMNIPLLSDAAGMASDFKMFQDKPETRTIPNMLLSGLGLLPFFPAAGAIKSLKGKGAIDADMLPQRLKEIGGSDRWDYIQKNPIEPNEFVDFDIKPTNIPENIETYYGNSYKGKDERLRYFDPELADISESVGDEFLTRWPVLKKSSGLVDEIPVTEGNNMLYRGISFEEMQDIKRTGRIQSKGEWNLGGKQDGTTSFSTDPGSAAYYAGGFAPAEHKSVFGKPSYVVGIKDPGTAVDIEALRGTHERSLPGSIDAKDIVSVHEGVTYGISPGKADIRMGHGGEYPSGHSGVDPQTHIGWRDISNADDVKALRRNSKKINRGK